MRTVAGGAVDPEFVRWSEVTVEALDAAIDAIKPGVTSGDVDRASRGVFERAGLADVFRKRTGYAMGIAFAPDWGEGHIFALKSGDERELRAGMVFHMPPALRRYGAGGVGFSETVLVTKSGCEVLTRGPRRLVHVG
jgi:Xaa-Pro dipeptidase